MWSFLADVQRFGEGGEIYSQGLPDSSKLDDNASENEVSKRRPPGIMVGRNT